MSSWTSRRDEFVLGLAAGVVTTTLTHPLDLMKIRLQLLRHHSTRTFELLQLVVSGIAKDARAAASILRLNRPMIYYYIEQWYRGVGPNLLGNAAAWSIYFTLYAEYKNMLSKRSARGAKNGDGLDGASYFGASALAGLTTSILTNPIWVLKTRILGSSRGPQSSYKSMTDGILRILKEEGISTFWRGTLPSLFQVLQASIQFSLYDQFKAWSIANQEGISSSADLSPLQYIYASATSKTISMCLLYPTQVVRSRLQQQSNVPQPLSIVDVCRSLWQNEGYFKGFYRGMGANIIRVLPSTCITFLTYETVKNYITSGV